MSLGALGQTVCSTCLYRRVQRHTVDQILDAVSPTLDVPVPLREEQLVVDVFKRFDFQVPKFSLPLTVRLSLLALGNLDITSLAFHVKEALVHLDIFSSSPFVSGSHSAGVASVFGGIRNKSTRFLRPLFN